MRRSYDTRSNIFVKDIQDQPKCKYVAFIGSILGDKAAIACDDFALAPNAVVLLRDNALDPTKPHRVSAFGSEMEWCVVERSAIEELSGGEWEKHKLEDAKVIERLSGELYGKATKVVHLPDGRKMMLPTEEDEVAEYEAAVAKEGEVGAVGGVVQDGGYL